MIKIIKNSIIIRRYYSVKFNMKRSRENNDINIRSSKAIIRRSNDGIYPGYIGRNIENISLKYINRFYKKLMSDVKYKWIGDLFCKKYNVSKKITESMGAVTAISKLVSNGKLNLKNRDNIHIYVVGDGKRPYTAAMIKMMLDIPTTIHSIDPILLIDNNEEYYKNGILVHNCTIENFSTGINMRDTEKKHAIVISVHGHGPIVEFYKNIPQTHRYLKKSLITIPCCSDYGIIQDERYLDYYQDKHILNVKNTVIIYTS